MIKRIFITMILLVGGQNVLADEIYLSAGQSRLLNNSIDNAIVVYCEKPTPTACAQAASVAKQEFYVCTQYEATDICFKDYVLKVKPKETCKEFVEECVKMCELTSSLSSHCPSYCQ